MAKQTIGGLIESQPHNDNYTEVYNLISTIQGQISDLELNKATKNEIIRQVDLITSNIENDTAGVEGVNLDNALAYLKGLINGLRIDVDTLESYGDEIEVTTTSNIQTTWINKFIKTISDTAINITILPNSSVPIPLETEIVIAQYGDGIVTVVEGTGVTINSLYSNRTFGKYATVVLRKTGADEWLLAGDLDEPVV